MADYPLLVFAAAGAPVPLVAVRDVLVTERAPANLSIDVGEATEEQLADPVWEAAFLRWLEPEVHEVAVIERLQVGDDELADQMISRHMSRISREADVAGRMIVADTLNRARVVYAFELLPALLADDGHDAWGAIEVLLRFLAQAADGLIYAEAEGYCDSDGELLLAETFEPNPVGIVGDDLAGNP
jgi:hypothetical protein